MSKFLKDAIDFITSHKLFSFFFLAMLVLNFTVIGLASREATDSFTCSSYDRSPLGTYALYTYLAENGVPVTRLKLAPYEELYKKTDTGQTLVMISPQLHPGPWEWNQLLAWVKKGNRLVTAGVFMPSRFFAGEFEVSAWSRPAPNRALRVALPVDSVFPYKSRLPPLPSLTELLYTSFGKSDSSKSFVAALSRLHDDMLPLLTSDTLVTAAKRRIGKGEWVMFAHFNPFANQILKNEQWFTFVCRLLTGDAKYGKARIFFDEYHNGYRATESLWAMLKYYQFDKAIICGSLLILLYLFFTGIRILPPHDSEPAPSRDIVPGLKSMAGLFVRYNSLGGLLKRELRLLNTYLLGSGDGDPRRLAESYCERQPLPEGISGVEELAQLLGRAGQPDASISNKELVTLFNTLVVMRKELAL